MMLGVIEDLNPIVIDADDIYGVNTPFGINEVPDSQLKEYAQTVAEKIVKEFIGSEGSESGDNR